MARENPQTHDPANPYFPEMVFRVQEPASARANPGNQTLTAGLRARTMRK